MHPAPSNHGHRVGAPVLASVADETETPGDAPPPVLWEPEEADEPVADEPEADELLDGVPVPPVTSNGAENRWGLVKSS